MVETRANAEVQALLDRLVAEGREIGVQVAAYRGDELVVDAFAGVADPAAGKAVSGETLFNAFSVAKALTATALHIQAERGLVDYDAPLSRYWPEFTGEGREKVTVRHVLTHRSGMMRMPPDVTPEQMCDWDHMIQAFARMAPPFAPGSASGYQSMSFGWLIAEVVRRTDPRKRDFGRFVRDEIAGPLQAPDLWLGIPDSEQGRVAIMDDQAVTVGPPGTPYRETTPRQVELLPEPFGRPEVRRACIPGVGSIFTARSAARLFAMLAGGGQLDGVRLLSPERVTSFSERRERFDELDAYFGDRAVPIGLGGYWLGGTDMVSARYARNPRALCHPGMGGSFAYADPDAKLAVAFCHNRLCDFSPGDDDSRWQVVRTLEAALN
jgi:CubicO group peptidase (beta-lactamase class C family)